jgi:iron complex outermembrane receptor protein
MRHNVPIASGLNREKLLMSKDTKSAALRLGSLAIGSAALALVAGIQDVMAQPEPSFEADEVIRVTGSHIRRDEFTASSPIQIITSEESAMEGLIDTGDVLQGASIASGSFQWNNRFSAFVVEGGKGIRSVSLRGLGAQRSLVLLNGRRSGPAGVRGQVAGFDLNVIPDSVIQRYEILKDGASSIYGSDAVAGVVNIITRTTVDGPELTFDYTMPAESGGESYSVSGATGFNFDRGNVVLSAQVEQREPIRLADRDFLSCQRDLIRDPAGNFIDRDDRSINGGTPYDGCENLYANTFIDFFSGERYIPAPDNVTIGPVAGYRPRTNGRYDDPGGVAYYEDQIFFPRANQETVQNEVTRSSVFVTSDFEVDILGGINWRNEALLSRRKTQYEGWTQFFPFIGSAPFFPYPNDPAYTNSTGFPVALPVIPYPSNGSVDIDYTSISTTLDGEFTEILSGWGWSIDAVYSDSSGQYRSNEIRASESGDIDYDDDPPVYDYMSPTILRGEYGPDFIQTIGVNTLGETSYEQYTLTGVITGDVASLPAGDVAVAAGIEYRDYSIDDRPDAASQAGDIWGASSAQITKGQDHVAEIFAEVEVPLLAGKRGVEELTLDVSARAFDYKSYGSDSVWKTGLNWQIIPALRLRTTRGTSFRAPALYELFLGNQTGFLPQTQIDPCIDWGNSTNQNLQANCAADGIPSDFVGGASSATIITGGGAGVLNAETSDASTLGVIITPVSGNISVAVDYFKIEIEDEVAQLGAGTILGGCYGAPVFPNAFCGQFTRDPGTNPGSPDAFGVVEINDSFLNVNNQLSEGWDLTVRYERGFNFGTLLVQAEGTYTLEDTVDLFDPNIASGFDTNDFNGTIGDPSFTSNIRFALERDDWTFNWYVDFINGTDNSIFIDPSLNYFGVPGAQRIVTTGSVRYHDLSARWEGAATTVIFGINNITDEAPPFVSVDADVLRYGNIPATGSQYDLMGRAAFMSVTRGF